MRGARPNDGKCNREADVRRVRGTDAKFAESQQTIDTWRR